MSPLLFSRWLHVAAVCLSPEAGLWWWEQGGGPHHGWRQRGDLQRSGRSLFQRPQPRPRLHPLQVQQLTLTSCCVHTAAGSGPSIYFYQGYIDTVYGNGSPSCISTLKLDFSLDSLETVAIILVPLELDWTGINMEDNKTPKWKGSEVAGLIAA